jgi:uncharacterized membrane protein YdjX (TVP38/TMEM64 family)
MKLSRHVLIESLYLIWMGFLPLISSSFLGYFALSNPGFFQNLSLSDQLIFWVSAVFIMGLALSPTTFFALFTGYVFGLQGIFPLIIAYSFASLLGYFLAKKLKGDAIMALLRAKFPLEHFLENVRANSFSWVFVTRLSPVFPFAITNALMAFLGVRLKQFFVAGTLGMLPRTLLALWTGMQAKTIQSLWQIPATAQWQDFASLFLLIASGFGMLWLGKKKAK